MGTMQGWVTRERLRQEQEQAKIEQARKEGFDDGYLAGKTFQLHAQPVANVAPKKLEKVRIALDTMRAHFEPNCQGQCRFPMVWTFCAEAIAELDAYERGGREGK